LGRQRQKPFGEQLGETVFCLIRIVAIVVRQKLDFATEYSALVVHRVQVSLRTSELTRAQKLSRTAQSAAGADQNFLLRYARIAFNNCGTTGDARTGLY